MLFFHEHVWRCWVKGSRSGFPSPVILRRVESSHARPRPQWNSSREGPIRDHPASKRAAATSPNCGKPGTSTTSNSPKTILCCESNTQIMSVQDTWEKGICSNSACSALSFSHPISFSGSSNADSLGWWLRSTSNLMASHRWCKSVIFYITFMI